MRIVDATNLKTGLFPIGQLSKLYPIPIISLRVASHQFRESAWLLREGVDYPYYLLRLSEIELIDRHHCMVARRIRVVRLPAIKNLDVEYGPRLIGRRGRGPPSNPLSSSAEDPSVRDIDNKRFMVAGCL